MVKKTPKKLTTASQESPSTTVKIVGAGGQVIVEVPSSLPVHEFATGLLKITPALLRFFAAVDDVMSEDDAMHPAKRQMGMGRIYRAWKIAREELDPHYDRKKDHQLKQRVARSPLQ